jgi:hypothetical protein
MSTDQYVRKSFNEITPDNLKTIFYVKNGEIETLNVIYMEEVERYDEKYFFINTKEGKHFYINNVTCNCDILKIKISICVNYDDALRIALGYFNNRINDKKKQISFIEKKLKKEEKKFNELITTLNMTLMGG